MAFNSTIFLFAFLPLFLVLYFIVPGKIRNFILLVFSILFFIWADKLLVFLVIASAIINFYGAKIISRKRQKWLLISLLVLNIANLGFFKYLNFGINGINDFFHLFNIRHALIKEIPKLALPLGISFYTFRILSYIVDVYRKKIEPSGSFLQFCTWQMMFPVAIAGPIVRYSDVHHQLSSRNVSIEKVIDGITRFIIGLAKKVLVAGSFATMEQNLSGTPIHELSMAMAWIGIMAFTLEIYYDFSGYSDMAIGLGKIIGFDFPENFNYPYAAKNIREFWRRWHMTLSGWLRDYLFLPIAYKTSGKLKKDVYLNIKTDNIIYLVATAITFLICGLWHGAAWTFVIWGLYFAFFLILEQLLIGKMIKKLWVPIQHIYTILIVAFGFVIFKSLTMADAISYFGRLLSFSAGNPTTNSYIRFFSITGEFVIISVVASIFTFPVFSYCQNLIHTLIKKNRFIKGFVATTVTIGLILLYVISITYLASGTYNPFIYARF